MTFFVVLFLVVFFGAFFQRVSGMGLGLVAGSALAVMLGPVEGILVVNVLAFVNAGLTTLSVRHYVDWKMFGTIAPMLLAGSIPGAVLIMTVSMGWMQIIVGTLLLIALTIVVAGSKIMPPVRGKLPALIAGIMGGFMNTLAGVAGPAITVYAQAAKWDQRAYAATLQPIFVAASTFSLLMKLLLGSGTLTGIDPWLWVVGFVAMVTGILMGAHFGEKLPRERARAIALSLAAVGGVLAIARGIAAL